MVPRRHSPDWIADLCRSGRQGGGQVVVVGIERRQIGADSHAGRAGQGCHRKQEVGGIFVGQGQGIGENKAAFGVGIVDLNGKALREVRISPGEGMPDTAFRPQGSAPQP